MSDAPREEIVHPGCKRIIQPEALRVQQVSERRRRVADDVRVIPVQIIRELIQKISLHLTILWALILRSPGG